MGKEERFNSNHKGTWRKTKEVVTPQKPSCDEDSKSKKIWLAASDVEDRVYWRTNTNLILHVWQLVALIKPVSLGC